MGRPCESQYGKEKHMRETERLMAGEREIELFQAQRDVKQSDTFETRFTYVGVL